MWDILKPVTYLVGGFGIFFIFPYIGFLIIPIDYHIFQRGGPTTNQLFIYFYRQAFPHFSPIRKTWIPQGGTQSQSRLSLFDARQG